ncbi:MAG: type II secretion system minor pseudopilin GspK [Colwellia sp.]|nr:type II secretion system minor pseudopilin GspK [Colwellia sp.]
MKQPLWQRTPLQFPIKKCQGVALITVMLIVALAAVLATQMTARLQLQMQRTANIEFNQQAYWYAMGAEAFAKRVLITTFEDEKDVTHLEQMWAQGETSYPVDFGQITGEIFDMQACFNLNALRFDKSKVPAGTKNPVAQDAFIELIISLGVEGVSQFEAEYMADALIDWLDKDSAIASAGGAEDNDYSAKEFPYLPANNYLASVTELRLIEHFTVPVINKLKDYVCVLPNTNLHEINVNTLNSEQPELLQALLDIPLEDAKQALSGREGEGFKTVNDFFSLTEIAQHKISAERKKQFVVDSQYFKLKSSTSFNNSYFSLSTLMKVEDNNSISVVSRTIGRE